MLKRLLEEVPAAPVAPSVATPAQEAEPAKGAIQHGYSRDLPVEAVFRSAARLNEAGSEKDTRHVVLDISGSGLSYAPGDSFGLYPTTTRVLPMRCSLPCARPRIFRWAARRSGKALIEDYALGPAPDMLFELIGYLTVAPSARRPSCSRKAAIRMAMRPRSMCSLPSTRSGRSSRSRSLPECLEPLQPRLYSISSSPLATPGEVHLTVDAVRYEISGRTRLGVASTFLADRLPSGSPMKVYLQKAHGFALPDDATKPIIMVGPGTASRRSAPSCGSDTR
jgi:sulfite reductase (NADPH) flavoprotein alpha-component